MLWILWLFGIASRDSSQASTAPLIVVNALDGQQQASSSSSTWITITEDTFEDDELNDGWGNFEKGKAGSRKVKRNDKETTCNGSHYIELKDDKTNGESSIQLRDSVDVTSYSNLRVSFKFLMKDYDTNNDKFVLEYSPNDGNSWLTVEEFYIDNALYPNNNVCYSVIVDFDAAASDIIETFLSQNAKLRFTSVVNGKAKVYIDDVIFSGQAIPETLNPTMTPTITPTVGPTMTPTIGPTIQPTLQPSVSPSFTPSMIPTNIPTTTPSIQPSLNPTSSMYPSMVPSESIEPSLIPSNVPTTEPTISPTISPTSNPTNSPTSTPTTTPLTIDEICPKSRLYPPIKHSVQPYEDTVSNDPVEDDLEEISSLAFSQQEITAMGDAKYAYVVSDKRQMSLKVIQLLNNNTNYINDTYNGNGIVVATYNLFPEITPTIGDWEDISLGPCTDIATTQYNLDDICIYIGDIGNNGGQNRTHLLIYKFKEPLIDSVTGPTTQNITEFATINFTYAAPFNQSVNKYYNAETLMVDWMGVTDDPDENPGDIYIVTKGGCSSAGIGKIPVSEHRDIPLDGSSSNSDLPPYPMPKIGPLPYQGNEICGTGPYREITGGDIRSDGRLIALVRVGPPASVYYFARTANQSVLDALVGTDLSGDSPSQCDYVSSVSGGLTNEYQYEAVAFVDSYGYRIGEISECEVPGCTPTLYQFDLEYLDTNVPPSITEPVSNWTTITYDTFDDGSGGSTWGNYQNSTTHSGANAIISNERSCDGDAGSSSVYSLKLSEDRGARSSAWHVNSYDCSSYDILRITFQFRFLGYDHLDTFFLEISFDDGFNYFMVSDWAYSVAESNDDNIFLNNEVCYDAKVLLVPSQFSSPTVTTTAFSSQVKLRIRNSGNAGNDRAFIDNILFEGHDASAV